MYLRIIYFEGVIYIKKYSAINKGHPNTPPTYKLSFYLCLTLSAELLSWRKRPSVGRPSVVFKL